MAITLLANDGILPLTPGAARIAVVGPAADELRIHFGAYSSVADTEIPIAIARIATGQVPGVERPRTCSPISSRPGCRGSSRCSRRARVGSTPGAATVLEAVRAIDPDAKYHAIGSFEEAASTPPRPWRRVADADVVIAVVGERTGWVGNHTAGEGRTTANPTLPGNQNGLVTRLRRAGKRVVSSWSRADLCCSSRSMTRRPRCCSRRSSARSPAKSSPMCSSGASSRAVASRRRSPGTSVRSRCTTGFPAGSGYDHPTLHRYGYVDLPDSTPLYPFGHGLTYTSFELEFEAARFVDGALRRRRGDEQRRTARHRGRAALRARRGRPRRAASSSAGRLHARLLAGGAAGVVEFGVPLERLAYTWPDGRRGVEAGDVALLLGLSSADIRDTRRSKCPN